MHKEPMTKHGYEKLSKEFLKHKNLIKIASKNSSFQIFINSLPNEI